MFALGDKFVQSCKVTPKLFCERHLNIALSSEGFPGYKYTYICLRRKCCWRISGISVAKYASLHWFCRLQFLRWCYINFGLIADQLDYSWLYSRTFKQRHSPFPLHPNSKHDHNCHYLRLHRHKWSVLYWRASSCEQGSKASQPTGKDQGAQFWDVYSLQLVAGCILQDMFTACCWMYFTR